jgi:hypothetical protein
LRAPNASLSACEPGRISRSSGSGPGRGRRLRTRPGPEVIGREGDAVLVLRQPDPVQPVIGKAGVEDAARVRGLEAEGRAAAVVPRADPVGADADLVHPPALQVGDADGARVPRDQRDLSPKGRRACQGGAALGRPAVTGPTVRSDGDFQVPEGVPNSRESFLAFTGKPGKGSFFHSIAGRPYF